VKNLIYQYWDGTPNKAVMAGVESMRAYAERIGAEYLFEENPRFVSRKFGSIGKYTPHYGALKPIYDDKFQEYDNVMFADTDVFVLEGVDEDIFKEFSESGADISLAVEPLQPKYRNDNIMTINSKSELAWSEAVTERYGCRLPRNKDNLLKVYNSGVVLYSREGLKKARKRFVPFIEYIKLVQSTPGCLSFYEGDQNYLHAMVFCSNLKFRELSTDWNVMITWNPYMKKVGRRKIADGRTESTKFVHIQFRGADDLPPERFWTIANKPVSDWGVE